MNFFEKASQCRKNGKWDPLVSSSFVCYAKKGTTLIVQFPGPKGTIWRLKVL